MTDTIKGISENIARQSGGQYIKKRYAEFTDEYYIKKPEKEKSGDEIIAETVAKLGLHKA